MTDEQAAEAARVIRSADALLVGAGAGMGVDSGLPDFRGNEGFWRAYPPYARLRLDFASMANPRWFEEDPSFAWGFYGHRLGLYRRTVPHAGFGLLRKWAERMAHGLFVFTSNVDGQFQRAGFPEARIVEAHGAIDWLQCLRGCGAGLFRADPFEVAIDEGTMRARPPLPTCPGCGGLARPNILMFGDGGWDGTRTEAQDERLSAWLASLQGARLAIVECGAGTAIPTVRATCEALARRTGGTLVRLNVREPQVPPRHLGLAIGALAGLTAIDRAM
ncbi:MAG: SIR2 family NAD-dependent protein deacylase [Myxococcales bacterium]